MGFIAYLHYAPVAQLDRVSGFEPHAYLAHVFTELPTATKVEDFEALLPWQVKNVITHS